MGAGQGAWCRESNRAGLSARYIYTALAPALRGSVEGPVQIGVGVWQVAGRQHVVCSH